MVQSDIPRGQTQSGKINANWYLQRLKASASNQSPQKTNLRKRSSNETIRVVRGTTATQGQHIPRVLLLSPSHSQSTVSQQQSNKQNPRSNSIDIKSATSLKSLSTTNPHCSSLSELNSNSHQSIKRDQRRNSAETLSTLKADFITRPPSTPVDPRCQREYSAKTNPVQRETCQLLGPQLCSDCIEIQTRANLSDERLPRQFVQQRLSALALRHFIPNDEQLDDQHLLNLIQNQQIQLKTPLPTPTVLTDEQYFRQLDSSFDKSSSSTPFYYKNYPDFISKYQSNQYPRLFLSETPSPHSSNPIFQQDSIDKLDVSKKYSFMKKASTIKYNFDTRLQTFISPKKTEQFYRQHRYLIDYSPPLLQLSKQQSRSAQAKKKSVLV